jgi:hypothetical protein
MFTAAWFWVSYWFAIGFFLLALVCVRAELYGPAFVLLCLATTVCGVLRYRVVLRTKGVEIRTLLHEEFVPWSAVISIEERGGKAYLVCAEGEKALYAVHLYAFDAKLAYLRSIHTRYR